MNEVLEGASDRGDGSVFGFVDPDGVSWVFVGRALIGGSFRENEEPSLANSGLGIHLGDQIWVFRRVDNIASLN